MTDLEQEYIQAYHNHLVAMDSARMIRETYQAAAMAYFQSLTEQIP